jgi:NADH dehydrogenase (ubiquinone) 1 alpha subcomplex subunit 9
LLTLPAAAPGRRRKAIGNSNVVINLLGREVETGHYSFNDVNVDAARRIAEASAAAGVARLVHFSALGASPDAPSANLRTKAAGEAAVKAAFPGATIMRPAPIFGTEDRLLRSWAACSKLLPAVPLIDGGNTRMAPVEVRDVAAAVTAVVENDELAGRTYTLAGPKEYTVKELVEMVFKTIREPTRTLPVPMALALLAAKPRDLLQSMVPFPVPVLPAAMYTSDAIKGFGVDYVMPPGEPGLAELGIAAPRKAEGINIDYLRAFRAGGYAYGELAGREEST